ncbi:MAG: delta(1)-pyrroline-2-carboxylate reductase family protein [Actinomycetota bacterium]|nr:delta(1)-pyrroline-2-carboxylate reductase family protein [Actinomycetota bacterium]
MKFFDPAEAAERLPYVRLADAIEEIAIAADSGEVQAPPRIVLPLPDDSFLLVMPASGAELTITKLVTVHPGNASRGLPTIQGEVVVMESETGKRLGILDGATVTARRTAALSACAARKLAATPDGPLLIIGAGAQGRAHLEAFREVLGVSKVSIVSRDNRNAESLADRARELGIEAEVAEDPSEALEEATLIVTATTSRTPVLPSGGLRDDAFVAAVGSFEPESVELPAGLVERASVVVDTLEGAREEAGDLIQAHSSGNFDWENAIPLGQALNGNKKYRYPLVFESVGSALWDLAAARTALSPGENG